MEFLFQSCLITWGLWSVSTLRYKIKNSAPEFSTAILQLLLLLTLYNVVRMPLNKPRWDYTEDAVANAILDVMNNSLSQRQAAQKHGVPQQTLSTRLQGQTALADQIQPKQHLSRNQEAKLVSWILRQESLGYAPSHSQIRACVLALLKPQGCEPKLGRNWVSKFIRRCPELRTKMGRRQEANRFDSFTPKAVHWFFDIREKEYGWIKPENTVNVDEGGIMAGFGKFLTPYPFI